MRVSLCFFSLVIITLATILPLCITDLRFGKLRNTMSEIQPSLHRFHFLRRARGTPLRGSRYLIDNVLLYPSNAPGNGVASMSQKHSRNAWLPCYTTLCIRLNHLIFSKHFLFHIKINRPSSTELQRDWVLHVLCT